MCLIAFAIGVRPDAPLWIASNRDEFFDRPTAPLHRWTLPNGMDVIGGRDLRDGGTWLGVNARGRVAMLTNVRGADLRPAAQSRGQLTSLWLSGEVDWAALLAHLAPADYGGFNLVVGDAASGIWGWVSNRHPERPHADEAPALHHRRLSPGLYGLSNATLDTGWPKTLRLKAALAEALQQPDAQAAQARLLRALGDTQQAQDHELPQTGAPAPLEQALSSPFVHMPDRGYGTRTSLLVRAAIVAPLEGRGGGQGALNWHLRLDEWTHASATGPYTTGLDQHHRAIDLTW